MLSNHFTLQPTHSGTQVMKYDSESNTSVVDLSQFVSRHVDANYT